MQEKIEKNRFAALKYSLIIKYYFQVGLKWSGRVDLNHRPSEPHSDTLPDCATPRLACIESVEVITIIAKPCQEQTKSAIMRHAIFCLNFLLD